MTFVTFALLVMVWLWQSKTGLINLDQALDHIVAVTWESAAVPSAFQIIAVSLYDSRSVRSFPERYSTSQEHRLTIICAGLQGESHHLVLFFSLMTGKLYTLGILRSLNSRPDLRGRMTSDDVGRRSFSDWQWGGNESENSITRRWSDVRLRIYLHLEVRVFLGGLKSNILTQILSFSPAMSPATTPRGQRLYVGPENSSTVIRQNRISPLATESAANQSNG